MSELSLADFLLARIAEDDGMAAADTAPCHGSDCGHGQMEFGRGCTCGGLDRWRADSAARRRIVELRHRLDHPRGGLLGPNKADAAVAQTLADAFKIMAQPYADHPDFRQDWRP